MYLTIIVFFNTIVAIWLALRAMDSARDNCSKNNECMKLIHQLSYLHQSSAVIHEAIKKRQADTEIAINDIVSHIEKTNRVVGALSGGAMIAMGKDGEIKRFDPGGDDDATTV